MPSFLPGQEIFVPVAVVESMRGWVIVTLSFVVQLFASVTDTVYPPAQRTDGLEIALPLDHE